MLTNITFTQENGKMRISWQWEGELDGVEIRFKKSEIEGGAGTLFIPGQVLKYPGKGTASVERRIENEWGLYDFTFLPRFADGKEGTSIVQSNIMIGEKKTIFWNIERQKEDFVVWFTGNHFPVPPQVASMVYEIRGVSYTYAIPYKIDAKTRLIFPSVEFIQQFCVRAQAPYDKAYYFVRSPK